ncbi:type II toxin-antitoxin system VapC family toxin [Acinetobacter puyangensis]|uniref:type II toxin-antitoxin system VapC family toxin n=1 Tax=Acinetobacter puyangensis TaxID=1096779 RepID=UPI003A4E4E8C
MFLIDTNIISEISELDKANKQVIEFFQMVQRSKQNIYFSVITIGELRRGVNLTRYKGDIVRADKLEIWLSQIINRYQHVILDINLEIVQFWGKIRVPNPHNEIDKLIAATALAHNLTLVTRNIKDFEQTGVKLLNPFQTD